MSVGDTGTISNRASGKLHVKFIVNSIAPIACTGPYVQPPNNGVIVAVDVTVETTSDLAEDSFPKFFLSGHQFRYIADSGTTFNGNLSTVGTYGCIDDSLTFPSGGMGPAEKVTAKVILDVPAPTGILVLESGFAGGFEYNITNLGEN